MLLGGEEKQRLAQAGLDERTDWREVGATVALPGGGNCCQRQVSLGRSPRTAPARPGRRGRGRKNWKKWKISFLHLEILIKASKKVPSLCFVFRVYGCFKNKQSVRCVIVKQYHVANDVFLYSTLRIM